MKYVIYGTSRVAKDYLYIFDDLSILYFIDDEYNENKFLTYALFCISNKQGHSPQ